MQAEERKVWKLYLDQKHVLVFAWSLMCFDESNRCQYFLFAKCAFRWNDKVCICFQDHTYSMYKRKFLNPGLNCKARTDQDMFAGFWRLETKPKCDHLYILYMHVVITDNFW